MTWVEPSDFYLHFATYLAMTMSRLRGENWTQRILPHIRNNYLVRYQAAIKQEDWKMVWDTLLKPFGEQQIAYRKHYKTKTAPEMFFGVEAKPCEPSEQRDHEQRDREQRVESHSTISKSTNAVSAEYPSTESISTRDSSVAARTDSPDVSESDQRKEGDDGIFLPGAAEWMDFWQTTEIPEHNTFIDFAAQVDESGFLRRVRSAPDLAIAEEEDFERRKRALYEAFRPKPMSGNIIRL
jgi:hypothetical protein